MLLVKRPFAGEEDVYLKHGLQVNEVEATTVLDRLLNHLLISVECLLQLSDKGGYMLQPQVSDDIHIHGGTYHAMDNAGQGATNHIRDP